ncbi:hypothetical protein NKW54_12300 [Acetobacter cerevisiae]|uniref:Uncharacterized protein n=1 Tax=Acetobacter cerevisiae TaxID=178900 RepID=A0ABT1ETK5_9PROT|nr:hypothetical protein [Acetobacter cerevisiae]MCP1246716.1 hypothetical protein [Acetobacter cerevisiae]MCP1256881.1 hypothetical protein [Acetobacter cerevisiae]
MNKDNRYYYLVAQTALGGIVVNITTYLLIICTMGLGAWLHSSAMEWTGALMFWIILIARAAANKSKAVKFNNPQSLADHLHDAYGVTAKSQRSE